MKEPPPIIYGAKRVGDPMKKLGDVSITHVALTPRGLELGLSKVHASINIVRRFTRRCAVCFCSSTGTTRFWQTIIQTPDGEQYVVTCGSAYCRAKVGDPI